MAINFTTGEYVVISRAYVEKILGTLDCGCTQQTLASLGYIGANPSEVLATGTVFQNATNLSYIRARPLDTTNPAYKNNQGITIYFCSDAHLNNSLELSTAFIDDKCFIKAQNVSGSAMTKGQLVYQSGFDATLQLPNIDLASAAASSTSAVIGILSADVAAGECGSVLVEGSFGGLNTSAFTEVGQTVFLSNTAGAFATSAGTVERVVAKATTLDATDGVILLDTVTAGTGGGGGGSGFFTDGTGTNAGVGMGAVAPTATGTNSLSQGNNSQASSDNSFALGNTAVTSGSNSFALGYYSYAEGTSSAAIGYSNSAGNNSFAQGYSNSAGTGYNATFAQGYSNEVNDDVSFAQGYSNYIGPGDTYNFTQGGNNYTASSENTLTQGYQVDLINGYQVFAQGRYIYADDTSGSPDSRTNILAQGSNLTLENSSSINFVQGYQNTVGGNHVMVQGSYSSWSGGNLQNCFAQGYNNDFTGSNGADQIFIQGQNNSVGGECTNIFIQGNSISTDTNGLSRCFAQGTNVVIRQDDQKVWGSNRTTPSGAAQVSHLIKNTVTTGTTTGTLATIETEDDTTYAITCIVSCRSATADQSASFVLAQATAYNDTGVLTLVGTPAFTSTNSGAPASTWTCDIDTSGTDVRVRVTGSAGETVQWCCDLQFVEVFNPIVV